MKVGIAIGPGAYNFVTRVYESLAGIGVQPSCLLCCLPAPRTTFRKGLSVRSAIKHLLFAAAPASILRRYWRESYDAFPMSVYYVKGINSAEARDILARERPDVVIVNGCGILDRRICEAFPNTFLNAHAGKLPEFRGRSNVEWAYLEDAPLIGTIHFIARAVDAGDIVYEERLRKKDNPTTVAEIRDAAFEQTFALFPKALRAMQLQEFRPIRQTRETTTRYSMHPFLVRVLSSRLAKRRSTRE